MLRAVGIVLSSNTKYRLLSTSGCRARLFSKSLSIFSGRMYNHPDFTKEETEAQRQLDGRGKAWLAGAGGRTRGGGESAAWLGGRVFPCCPAPGICG